MSASQHLVDGWVDEAIAQFRNYPPARLRVRQLADEMPEQFFEAAVRHIARPETRPGYRLLTMLLMAQTRLFDLIVDPELSPRDHAIQIARRILQCDPWFDMKIARRLPDRYGANDSDALSGSRAVRVLDILDTISPGRRVMPLIFHLVDSADARLSARAALFLGRRVRTLEWARKQLERKDARIRANAVEAIWGVNQPGAVRLLTHSTLDPDNRVAGNALMGLHMLRQPGIDALVASMAAGPVANFRRTAIWMMGRMASPEFIPQLTILETDDDETVRRAAADALVEIRKAETSSPAVAITEAEDAMLETDDTEETGAEPLIIDIRLDGTSFAAAKR